MSNNVFTILKAKPSKNDPYIYLYNDIAHKGKSLCIEGKPMDSDCSVLCNCVGWACARFNHIYNLLTGYDGIKFNKFCCNAEDFIEVAKSYGLTVSDVPQVGAIMVWSKGKIKNKADGCGHVAIVEDCSDDKKLYKREQNRLELSILDGIKRFGENNNQN